MALSPDGNILLISDTNGGVILYDGIIYIYINNNGIWNNIGQITCPIFLQGSGSFFGSSITFSSDGNILYIGAINYTSRYYHHQSNIH